MESSELCASLDERGIWRMDTCVWMAESLHCSPETITTLLTDYSAQSCPALCDPVSCSTPGLHVRHELPEFTQTHVHWVSDTIQPSHPLLSPSPPTFNLSQHQGHFKWVCSSDQVAKGWELELQHQSFQWIFKLRGEGWDQILVRCLVG